MAQGGELRGGDLNSCNLQGNKLLPPQADLYFSSQLRKLRRREEDLSCVPTNQDLLRIIVQVRSWDVDEYAKVEKSLVADLSRHGANLIDLAASIFWGQYWRMKVNEATTELKAARIALKTAKRRSRLRGTGPEDIGVLRCSLRVKEASVSLRRAMFAPGLNGKNRPKGKKQDVPTKIAHLNIQRYFLSKHPSLSILKRSDLTQRLLDATGSLTGLYRPSQDAFRMREKRLRKQTRFLPRA
jgi:hypothetical protein